MTITIHNKFNNMKKFLKLLLVFLYIYVFSFAGVSEAKIKCEKKVLQYFIEVAFGSEFGSGDKVIKKWNKNMNIYLLGTKVGYLEEELDKIIQELNSLIGQKKLKVVEKKSDSNFTIFFGSAKDYVKTVEKSAGPYVANNWGLFWIYYNANNEITNGSLYVDITRANKVECRHLLREELTQSLGLMNDSLRYSDSIFYQKWTKTTQYAPIDKELIKLLYNEEIKPGMSAEKFKSIVYY